MKYVSFRALVLLVLYFELGVYFRHHPFKKELLSARVLPRPTSFHTHSGMLDEAVDGPSFK